MFQSWSVNRISSIERRLHAGWIDDVGYTEHLRHIPSKPAYRNRRKGATYKHLEHSGGGLQLHLAQVRKQELQVSFFVTDYCAEYSGSYCTTIDM